ncbi:MAG: NTP transferase domain-containing protein [Firmicutes bacterium]|nr:NTP transferase domain-containing protein [Bacillota bacterium]
MKAIVMAGGKGTRLKPLTCKQPKPMVPVAGRPMMEYIIELLKRYNFTEIGVTLFYLPELIENHFGDGKDFGVSLQYFVEEMPLGTAGSVKNAEHFLDQTFLVISGDALTDINLEEALAFHRQRKALVTIVLTKVSNPLDYGVVITDDDGRIKRFLEKPGWGEVFSDTVNTGIYIIEPEVFQFYEKNKAVDFSKDLFPALLAAGQPLYGFVADGYWSDVGNLNQYRQANYDLLAGKIQFTPPGQEIAPGIWAGEGTEIDQESSLEPPLVLGKYVRVCQGAKLGAFSVIGDHSLVNKRASIKRSILWNHTYLGYETELRGSILAHHNHLKSCVAVYEGAVLGEGCTVGSKAVIKPEIKIWPEKYIESGSVVNSSLVWGLRWGAALFGRQGIEKIANLEFTPEFAAKLGAAVGAVLPEKSHLVVSTDHFLPTRVLKTAFVCGCLGAGINVYDLGVMTTAAARHAVVLLQAKSGVHLRLSPLNEGNMRVEFIDEQGLTINRDQERKLEQAFFTEEFRRMPAEHLGTITRVDQAYRHYLEEIMKVTAGEVIREAAFRVVTAYDKGAVSLLLPTLLADLGCEILTHERSGPRLRPRTLPERLEWAAELAQQVKREEADLGVVLDQNGEHLILVDEKGRILKEEQLLALLSLGVLKYSPVNTIAIPVTAPRFFEEVVNTYRGKVVRTKANPRALMEKVAEERLFPGGHEQTHFQPAFDGIYSLAKLLELMAKEKVGLSELVAAVPPYYTAQKAVDCSWEDKGRIMRSLFEENKEKKIEIIDGLKVYHDQGWALVLPDAEEPVFQVYSEAGSQEEAEALTSLYSGRISELKLQS